MWGRPRCDASRGRCVCMGNEAGCISRVSVACRPQAATQGSSGIRETRFSTGIDWAALRARAATSAAAAADDAEGPESPDEDLALPEEPGRRGAEATGSPAAHREARPPAAAAHAPGFRGHAHGGGKERVDLSNLCVPGTAQHRAVLWHGSLDVSGLGSAQVQARELAGQGPLSAMLGQPGGTLNVGRLLDEGKTAKFFAEMRRSRSRTCTGERFTLGRRCRSARKPWAFSLSLPACARSGRGGACAGAGRGP